MIYYLNGIIKEKSPIMLVLDVNGVGYELRIPLSTYEKLPEKEKTCTIYTHLYLSTSQDEMRLYGFSTLAEKNMFVKLISISGIGPKIALSVLSSMQISMIIKVIQKAEDGLLAKVPGIGKKTAQRIIVELKDEINQLLDYLDTGERSFTDTNLAEVEKALISLGYPVKDIQKALSMLPEADKTLPIEQIIKNTIKIIYQKSAQ